MKKKGFDCLLFQLYHNEKSVARQRLLPLHARTTSNNPLKDKFVNSHLDGSEKSLKIQLNGNEIE